MLKRIGQRCVSHGQQVLCAAQNLTQSSRVHTAKEEACGRQSSSSSTPISEEQNLGTRMRGVLRKWPAPVTVITAASSDPYSDMQPHSGSGSSQQTNVSMARHTKKSNALVRGMTCGSFTSISLQPPLVAFNVHSQSHMASMVHGSGTFAVHFLGRSASRLNATGIPVLLRL